MTLAFFPTPYPDETIYSVLCRLSLRLGCPSYHHLSNLLIGRQLSLNSVVPHGIGKIASHIPKAASLAGEYFVHRTTTFPYFAPFLTEKRKQFVTEYLLDRNTDTVSTAKLGIHGLRHPKHFNLRFCNGCWNEDIRKYGEPYWHRTHQLPGVMMCPQQSEPLMDSPILISQANFDFYAASVSMVNKSVLCGKFKDNVAEKLVLLSLNSQWLLENGHKCSAYEQIYPAYDLWLRYKGFSSLNGRAWHKKIFEGIVEWYGEEFLELVDANDNRITQTWAMSILLNPSKLQHPMYHILLQTLLAGSTAEFIYGTCSAPLPYGEGPWPCRNAICPYNLKDVIENVDMKYDRGLYRAAFECPYCGFIYKRKKPIPKEGQYAGTIYVASYGHLWFQKLRECLVEQGLSPRRTCEYLKCDMYTVQKYAVKFGYIRDEDATPHLSVRNSRPKQIQQEKLVLTEREQRLMWRQRWEKLISENPNAKRSQLKSLDSACYIWLAGNDREWLEKHLPMVKKNNLDWGLRDSEYLEKVRGAVCELHNAEGKPVWISLHRITLQTGINQIRNKKCLERMPKTADFLREKVESIDDWRKRKIIWAIRILRENDQIVTPHIIAVTAKIQAHIVIGLQDFIKECVEREEISEH